jgi:CBS-domain-containing membrane protein
MRTPTIPMPQVPSAARTAPLAAPPAAPRPNRNATDVAMTAARKMLAAGAMSDALWAPFVSAVLILAAGSLALATGRPWLFAALGPTAVLLAANPGHPTTRFHAIVVGHLVALACACIAVLLLGAGDAPTLLGGAGISVARVWASALAIGMMTAIQPSLKAYHPPAAATVLLITLGVHRASWSTVFALLGGVLVVAVLGEWFQRLRLQQQRKQAA